MEQLQSIVRLTIMERLRSNEGLKMFFKLINKLSDLILLVTLGGLFFTVIVQIIGRILGTPAPWTEEGTRYLFLWMMFIALSYGFKFAESARVSLFINLFPSIMKKVFGLIYLIATIGFFAFIAYYGAELVNQQLSMNEMGAAILIPMAYIGICVPISGVLGVISTLQCVIETPEKIFGGAE